ncbi:MAG TPA: DNA translocase FtsK 4TM domain-containing protein, partial [Tichowtungia sp.]|nr:DNA translocase FtsK 4TM domain-containing protein [Tichowtungia sp.]
MAKKSKSAEPVRSKKKEAFGIMLLGLCFWSFFCFFSYRPEYVPFFNDPPEPYSPSGIVGVWFSFAGFMSFGMAGYLVPFALLMGGLLMTLRSYEKIWPVWSWLAGAIIGFAGLAEYLPWQWAGRVAAWLNIGSPGGLIGNLLAERTLGRWIGHAGASIFFVILLVLALLQLTGMHPFTPFVFLWNRIKALMARRKEAAGQPEPEPAAVEKPKKRTRRKKKDDGELFTPPVPAAAPAAATKPTPAPAPKPAASKPAAKKKVPVAPEPKSDLEHVSVNIAPGVDESGYQLPPLTLLDDLPPAGAMQSTENTAEKAKILQATLEQFGVEGEVTHVETGPTVTSYEVTPAPGVRVEKISSLERNIALALRAQSIR